MQFEPGSSHTAVGRTNHSASATCDEHLWQWQMQTVTVQRWTQTNPLNWLVQTSLKVGDVGCIKLETLLHFSRLGIHCRPTTANNIDCNPFCTVQLMLLQWKQGSPYSITECRVPQLIPVLGSQPAGDVSHEPGGRLPLLSARPAVTRATLKRAATNFAAWWTEAQWVWTVCLRLLPDSVAAAIWTEALLCLSPSR